MSREHHQYWSPEGPLLLIPARALHPPISGRRRHSCRWRVVDDTARPHDVVPSSRVPAGPIARYFPVRSPDRRPEGSVGPGRDGRDATPPRRRPALHDDLLTSGAERAGLGGGALTMRSCASCGVQASGSPSATPSRSPSEMTGVVGVVVGAGLVGVAVGGGATDSSLTRVTTLRTSLPGTASAAVESAVAVTCTDPGPGGAMRLQRHLAARRRRPSEPAEQTSEPAPSVQGICASPTGRSRPTS